MTRHSASPPDLTALTAKNRMIEAFVQASPARVVERHPLLSVTAVASAALAATVVLDAPVSRKLVSVGIVQAAKSVMPFIQAYAMGKLKASSEQPGQTNVKK